MKYAVMNNRGSQLGVFTNKQEAQNMANSINRRNMDVFAWLVEVDNSTQEEDMPGRGYIYG